MSVFTLLSGINLVSRAGIEHQLGPYYSYCFTHYRNKDLRLYW